MTLDAAELLKALVRINTTDPPGREMDALRYIKGILDEAGIESYIQQSAPERGNIAALLPGSGSAEKPIVLISHIDVVGADESQWSQPPFAANEVDGYIYGRGTVDTKQLTVMELIAFLSCAEKPRRRDLYFVATCDEECGSAMGLQYFLANPITLGGRTFPGAEIFRGSDVISEGGGFPIVVGDTTLYLCEAGQKGCGSVTFTVPARHSGGPFFPGKDGIVRAMELVEALSAQKLEGRVLPTVSVFCEAIQQAAGGREDWEQAISPMMRSILSAMTRNTVTPTLIRGKNLDAVEVSCDVRLLPGFDEAWLRALLEPIAERFDAEFRVDSFHAGYESDISGPFSQCLAQATAALSAQPEHTVFLPFVSMGASDGRFLGPLGAKVYGYSPVLAFDMTFDTAVQMVHGIDERIHRDSLLFGCKVLCRALQDAQQLG